MSCFLCVLVKPIFGWCVLFAALVVFATGVMYYEPWADAKTEFESQDTKHLLHAQDQQTAALVLSVLSSHLHNEDVYFSSIEYLELTPSLDRSKYCHYNVTESICLPHKDSIHHPSSERLILWGYDENQFITVEYKDDRPISVCPIKIIVMTPPKGTGLDPYDVPTNGCGFHLESHITGVWTWHVKDIPAINGTIHVVDLHAVYDKYADYLN